MRKKKKLLSNQVIIAIIISLVLISAVGIAISMYRSSSEPLSGKAFGNLSSSQKQLYWKCMADNKCNVLLKEAQVSKDYTAYRKCAKDCSDSASNLKPESYYCNDSDGNDYLTKSKVVSNLYPQGKEDYCFTFPGGKTYLMEGICKDKKYAYVQKGCGEMGEGYGCEEGKCLMISPLITVFNISATVPLGEKECADSNLESIIDNNYNTNNKSFQKLKDNISNTNVIIWIPEPTDEKNKVAMEGLTILKAILPIMENYFGSFPCDSLHIKSYQNYSAMWQPGNLGIGGDGGINHPWLLSHEVTHSYFHTKMSPQWLAEGTATSMPFIFITEVLNNPPDFWTINTTGTSYNIEDDLIYNKPSDIDWDKPICELEGNYLAASYAGRFLTEDLYLKIGKQNLLNGLKLLHDKYIYTNQKITYSDFCKSILYFTPTNQYDEIKKLLNYKLCGACEQKEIKDWCNYNPPYFLEMSAFDTACKNRVTNLFPNASLGNLFGKCASVYQGIPIIEYYIKYKGEYKTGYFFIENTITSSEPELPSIKNNWNNKCSEYLKVIPINWTYTDNGLLLPTTIDEAKKCINAGAKNFEYYDDNCPIS